jgi:exodeoxyribonuclease V alpha subunit
MQQPYNPHKTFAMYFKGCEALAYALSSRLSDGNICIDLRQYQEELPDLLHEQQSLESFSNEDNKFWPGPQEFEKQTGNEDFVTTKNAALKPFIVHNGKAYLQRYFHYETLILEKFRLEENNINIITGGPGTGKTHSVGIELAAAFKKNQGLKVALAAPTAKAAARMNESIQKFANNPENAIEPGVRKLITGLRASTIHILLGTIPNSSFFRYNEENKLPFDIVIIDECSMVDVALMAKLLSAIHEKTQLYLLGDRDQLASVEAGSIFGDLCRAETSVYIKNRIKRLSKSYRFSKDQGIWKISQEIISGKIVEPEAWRNDEQVSIDTGYSEALFARYADYYIAFINEEDTAAALKELEKVRFLCATREDDHSVREYNEKISKHLAGKIGNRELFNPGKGIYHNQPIIVTKNDYNLSVSNGDVGIIRKTGDRYYAFFPDPEGGCKKIPASYLNNFDTVFAMTIHKSQGSEFDHVAVILPEKRAKKLLTRELLYTAVTRAKNTVLVQGTKEAIEECTMKEVKRASGITERLNTGLL